MLLDMYLNLWGGWLVHQTKDDLRHIRFVALGLTIASLRKIQGLPQEELAEKAEISRSHLSAIEAPNIVRSFSVEVLFNIADALHIQAGELLDSVSTSNVVHRK